MSPTCSGEVSGSAARRSAAARRMANALHLAAAPTFAAMALLTGVLGSSPETLCSAASASPLGGMVPMYLLMSAFHAASWLKLISGQGRTPRIGESRA